MEEPGSHTRPSWGPFPPPGRAQGPALSVPTCHFPDWLSFVLSEFLGGERAPGKSWKPADSGLALELAQGRRLGATCLPTLPHPGFSQGPLFPPSPKVGHSSAQDPEEITSCLALLPPILAHLFLLSLCGFSTGKEKLTASLCARSLSDVKWDLRHLPTKEHLH